MSHGLDRNGPPTPRLTRIGTIMSSVPGTRAATAVSGLTDESVIGDIFGHYCSLVYQAVLECIVSSLLIIGDCVKPPGRMQSGIEVESRKISRFVILHIEQIHCTSCTTDLTEHNHYDTYISGCNPLKVTSVFER